VPSSVTLRATFRSGIGPPVGGSGVLTMVSASDSSSISCLAVPHRGEGPARLSDILRLVRRSHMPRSARVDDMRHSAASRATSVEAHSVITVSDDLEIIAFSTVEKLWSWLEHHHATHPGAWV
jgi:hypothetical protein